MADDARDPSMLTQELRDDLLRRGDFAVDLRMLLAERSERSRLLEEGAIHALEAVSARRRARLLTVDLEDARGRLAALAAAAVDPLLDALCARDAALVRLGCQLYAAGLIDLDRQHWWTPVMADCLASIATARDHQRPGVGALAAMVNDLTAVIAARWRMSGGLPLGPPVAEMLRSQLRSVVHSLLLAEIEFGGRLA